ncbi:hypothetical protein C8R45DRAFT_991978 [Mycena sanguinolenta]|nr:hypothetical protein C8R45DRAFT_991978 [Mycena sanguinolenta]
MFNSFKIYLTAMRSHPPEFCILLTIGGAAVSCTTLYPPIGLPEPIVRVPHTCREAPIAALATALLPLLRGIVLLPRTRDGRGELVRQNDVLERI